VHGFGVNISDSALTALWFTVVLLAYIGYRIGRSLHASGIRMIFEVLGTAAFGILMIVLKSVLH
jgi:VIT1/CCC1 family predicted Fe2+/Mn2+ transporter